MRGISKAAEGLLASYEGLYSKGLVFFLFSFVPLPELSFRSSSRTHRTAIFGDWNPNILYEKAWTVSNKSHCLVLPYGKTSQKKKPIPLDCDIRFMSGGYSNIGYVSEVNALFLQKERNASGLWHIHRRGQISYKFTNIFAALLQRHTHAHNYIAAHILDFCTQQNEHFVHNEYEAVHSTQLPTRT